MNHYQETYQNLHNHFLSGATLPYRNRKVLLKKLYKAIERHEKSLLEALNKDLKKSEFEAYTNEIGIVYREIKHSLAHLRRWMKPKRMVPDIHLLPGKAKLEREPFGVCLIMAPWNYPFQLLISPLVGALAAGNTVILKPSEVAPATAKAMTDMIEDCFSANEIAVVNGGPEESTNLLDLPVDHIFYTGSTHVGRIVMEAASKRLTPLILELGGKSPAIVTPSARIDVAARRIAWGKFNNAGQTCVAPDYVLVHKEVYEAFMEKLRTNLKDFYGEDPQQSQDFGRIINQRHFDRLCKDMTPKTCLIGGQTDKDDLYIAPTVYGPVGWDHPLMVDEIFGPLLPVLVYDDLDQAIAQIRQRPKPLALYVFSENRRDIKEVNARVAFGGGAINTTVLHVASTKLPFGGVGPSGLGRYHGRDSFEAFSHQKSLLKQPTWPDLGLAYPHKKIALWLVRKILK